MRPKRPAFCYSKGSIVNHVLKSFGDSCWFVVGGALLPVGTSNLAELPNIMSPVCSHLLRDVTTSSTYGNLAKDHMGLIETRTKGDREINQLSTRLRTCRWISQQKIFCRRINGCNTNARGKYSFRMKS